MDLKSFLGKKTGPYREIVSSERILSFSQAVGALDTQEASPTFMTIFRQGEFDLLHQLQIPLSKVLHAEQEYHYLDQILAGDILSYDTILAQVFEKTGSSGKMLFITFETTVRTQRKSTALTVGVSKTTVVVR